MFPFSLQRAFFLQIHFTKAIVIELKPVMVDLFEINFMNGFCNGPRSICKTFAEHL